MADWYWTPKAFGTGGTNVGTSANPFRGFKKVSDQIAAGVIQGGDNVYRVVGSGPIALADRLEFAANTTSVSSSLGFALNNANHGPMAGTSFTASSLASGVRFFMQSTMADPAIDMRGISANSERCQAALRLRGEDIEVHDLHGYAPDWNYIRDGSGGTRIAGPGDAETRSMENFGLLIVGNGNKLYNTKIDGNSRHCRSCIYMAVMVSATSGASTYKTNEIVGFDVYGANQGIDVQPQGGGVDLKRGQKLIVRGSGSLGGRVHTGSWGREGAMSTAYGYNAQQHGNALRVVGKFYGGAEVYDVDLSGNFQDGLVLSGGVSLVGRDSYIHDIGSTQNQYWNWTGSAWSLTALGSNSEGNAVKCGLSNYDGTSGSDWLVPGTAGGFLDVDEIRTILLRLKIYRARAIGVTTNNSRGVLMNSLEIDDCGNACVNLQPDSRVGNYWLMNCFLRKIDSEPSNFALLVQANARVCGMFNNILWSNPSVSTQRDVRWNTALAIPAGMKDKNLLVTGRSSGGSATYPTVGDLTPQTPAWTQGSGLASDSPLRGAGTSAGWAKARTTGSTYGIGSGGSGKSRWSNPPHIGPYAS